MFTLCQDSIRFSEMQVIRSVYGQSTYFENVARVTRMVSDDDLIIALVTLVDHLDEYRKVIFELKFGFNGDLDPELWQFFKVNQSVSQLLHSLGEKCEREQLKVLLNVFTQSKISVAVAGLNAALVSDQ